MHRTWYISIIFLSIFIGALSANIYESFSDFDLVSELVQEDGGIDVEDNEIEDNSEFDCNMFFEIKHTASTDISNLPDLVFLRQHYESFVIENDSPPPRLS